MATGTTPVATPVSRRPAAPETWIHQEGVKYLESNDPHVDGYATMQARLLFPVTPGQAAASFSDLFVPSAPPERTIADGDVLDLGGVRLTAIHAPGHSEDLVALFWEDEGVLILADAAQGTGFAPGRLPALLHLVRRRPGQHREADGRALPGPPYRPPLRPPLDP